MADPALSHLGRPPTPRTCGKNGPHSAPACRRLPEGRGCWALPTLGLPGSHRGGGSGTLGRLPPREMSTHLHRAPQALLTQVPATPPFSAQGRVPVSASLPPTSGTRLGARSRDDSYKRRPSLGKVSGDVKGQPFLVGTFSSQGMESQAILSAGCADITTHTSLGVICLIRLSITAAFCVFVSNE